MSTVWITVGIPASGKSTWAREMVKSRRDECPIVISCRDDIREAHGFELYGDPATEQKITRIQRAQIEAALLEGMDVIVADTNINKTFRNRLIKFAHQHGADVKIKVFNVSLDEAIWRDSMRATKGGYVGPDVINKMYNQFKAQELQDESLPVRTFEPLTFNFEDGGDCIVVDIDGTVAKHVARSPYDYSKVLTDEVINDVRDVVRTLNYSFDVVFVSGREDSCYDDTATWLKAAFPGMFFNLYMRKTGDQRPDWEIKNEIYDREVIPKWNVRMVFDDRDQVVRHLRKRGITVAQVAPGRF